MINNEQDNIIKNITKEQILEATGEEQQALLFEFMAKNNNPSFNFNKSLEECIEFAEVIVKLQTKSKTNPKRPDPKDAVSEFGDLIIRGMIALSTLFPDLQSSEVLDMLVEAIDIKCNKLIGWLEKGTYVNGL